MNSAAVSFYPDPMGRIVMLAMEEILGHSRVIAALDLAHLPNYIDQSLASSQDLKFPFDLISRLQTSLESAYGPRAGRGLSLRIGRVCVKYGLREYGSELGVTGLAFRLLPLPKRLKVGSEALAGLFNQLTGQHIRLEVDEKHIYWHIERCPLCWERHAGGPCCDLAVGFLQEAFNWVGGGKYFQVEEKKCIACGDSTCTIVIDRTPLG
jgi:predicted hydrocarbon binding protein